MRQGARWEAREGANGRGPYSACLEPPAPGYGDRPARREGLQGLRRRGSRVAQGPRRRLGMVSHKVGDGHGAEMRRVRQALSPERACHATGAL